MDARPELCPAGPLVSRQAGGAAPGRTPPAALLSFRARLGGLHERHAHNSFSAQGRAQRAILTMPLPVPAALAGPRQRPRRMRLPTGATPPSASSRRWRKLWTPPTPTCFCWRVPSSDLSARSGCSSSGRGPDGILLVTRLHQVQLFFPGAACTHFITELGPLSDGFAAALVQWWREAGLVENSPFEASCSKRADHNTG